MAKYHINLTVYERLELEKIILLANGECMSNKDIATELGIYSADITQWTKRWIARSQDTVIQRLSDLPRSGAPDTFSPEQICQLVALACEKPEAYGYPISHWTQKELANEMMKQGIVASISQSQICRILQKLNLPPHRSRYWLNSKADEKKDERIADICNVYHEAIKKKMTLCSASMK
jgi:transposase